MEKYFKKEYLLLLLFITSLPSIIYFLNFVCSDIKNTPETWAQFGDFVGGTTNVVLGLINIIVTVYLALIIKNLDKSRLEEQKELDNLRHQQNLILQNELFIRNLKENEFKEIDKLICETVIKLNKLSSPFVINNEEGESTIYNIIIKNGLEIKFLLERNFKLFSFIPTYIFGNNNTTILDSHITLEKLIPEISIISREKKINKLNEITVEYMKVANKLRDLFIEDIHQNNKSHSD
ncbi:hypothetical protein [Empedobacter falsenii]|uniref:Uncharacterized protein n=1 Tax=Empedobacter falsenii TaxID=343874 RepID=A0AAW7DKC5_9FLAO|nr:hypothetical protein [Empedobacter falsenii]MDM1551542.1 hypothetical protein [Empedobacter falsenii]